MADEGFHEIQLNGKQLVFLFMALTVFSVVVFLCGVMVGRGVRQPRVPTAAAAAETPVDPTAIVPPAAAAPINADRPPVSTQELLTYAERLEARVPPTETFKERVAPTADPVPDLPPDPVAESPAPAPKAPAADPRATAAAPRATTPAVTPASASFSEPPGNGFAVQVGAYPRNTADVIAKGLAAKGFPSFITPRERGLFAVRVGKYTDRREAEAVARRLERDEQFNKPWVTR